ncbi:hypothetical protein [Flavobacterium sp. N1736]|uniref:hypothetical protein n=1 Tax=Flavobacterium sp. N1736 TaxID=2986823 RepID=UPI0022244DFE|nr:hypothetical protein [Flavobacterium sp. N1736]
MEELLKKAAAIARDVTIKEGPIADKEGRWVSDTMQALKDSKLTGLLVPKESGDMD